MKINLKIKWVALLAIALVLAACEGSSSATMNVTPVAITNNAVFLSLTATSAPLPEMVTPLPTSGSSASFSTSIPGTPMPGAATPTTASASENSQASALKAAEIDDNVLWDDYLKYRDQHSDIVAHQVDISERYIISVTSDQETPILGAHVQIYGNQALLSDTHTYANGKTLFFPKSIPEAANATSFSVVVDKNGATSKFVLTRHKQDTWQVALSGQTQLVSNQKPSVKLDILFLLDTTGSMGDELAQLQANILKVSSQIGQLPGNPDVHYGMVAYKDRGDEYVTRIFPFTTDVQKFEHDLSGLSAGGGGDEPESLNAALHDAVHGVDWRGDDTIKLIFLVSDAPPHLDYPNDYDYAVEMRQAAQNGIKIYSLAASGLNAQGEYIFRQMAQFTMGHFIFITYANGSGGAPGNNTTMNVPKADYQVELLDQLVLRLIRQEVLTVVQNQN